MLGSGQTWEALECSPIVLTSEMSVLIAISPNDRTGHMGEEVGWRRRLALHSIVLAAITPKASRQTIHHGDRVHPYQRSPRPAGRSCQFLPAPSLRTRINEQYSQAVRAGNTVYTSGSVAMTKEGQMVQGTVRQSLRV